MNGTTLRIATAVACVAALAAPSGALAKSKKHRVGHKTAVVKKAQAPKVTVQVPHDYVWGGNGAGTITVPAGTQLKIYDTVAIAEALGNNLLAQLGLPPLPVQLP